jgi:hypothetical protein
METDPALYRSIRDVFKRIVAEARDERRQNLRDGVRLQQAHFSDSFVYSLRIDPKDPLVAAVVVVYYAAALAAQLLKEGIVVRGGIARGWAFHRGNILFGAGVNAAYDLESRVAGVPRIVVADDVFAMLGTVDKRSIRRDSDGCRFIDSFAYLPDDDIQTLRARLEDNLRTDDVGLLAKYRWLAIEFNRACRGKPGVRRLAV